MIHAFLVLNFISVAVGSFVAGRFFSINRDYSDRVVGVIALLVAIINTPSVLIAIFSQPVK